MQGTLTVRSHVRSMQDDEGAVLLDLKQGKYYSLNGVAAHIWSKAAEGKDLPEILDDLEASYQAPASKLRQELTDFVSGLKEKGLVDVGGSFPA